MDQAAIFESFAVGGDTHVLPSWMPLPGFGVLPINAYVIQGQEPVLVDCGLPGLAADFMEALRSVIDPQALRWIWLTHVDTDHVGALEQVLAEAPRARVVTSYLGLGKLSMRLVLPPDRVFLLNPGQTLEVGDGQLSAFRPPTYDAPETCGFVDGRSGSLFTSDSFGALLDAPVERAEAVAGDALVAGMLTWATVDAPWLSMVDRTRFGEGLGELGRISPSRVLSSHLPPAGATLDRLLEVLARAPEAPPFVGPDQAAVTAMMAAG